MNVLELLRQGHEAEKADHQAAEVGKLGTLRGGSSGVVDPAGRWYGKCGRLSHLRQEGVELGVEANRLEMFAAGVASETVVAQLLRRALGEGRVKFGPTAVELRLPVPGTDVFLGARPDVVLTDEAGGLELGLELKLVSSIWTAKGVHFEMQPKSGHLIQAGLYSLLLSRLPFTLLYSSRCDWHLSTAPKWLQDKFPPGTYDVEFKDGPRGPTPFKILPFNRAYDLRWSDDGFLTYTTEGLGQVVKTKVDEAALWRYYQGVDAVRQTKQLPPRPESVAVDGTKSFKECDYCSLKSVCDSSEGQYDIWRDQVQLAIESGATK